MSSIRDLRDTLEQHAQGLPDTDLPARPAAVRDRVRAVRRRRRATAAVGAVAATVAVVAGLTLSDAGTDDGPAPADRSLVGLTAPETITSLGYTYAFAEGAEGTDTVSLDLADHTGPVVVTWATASTDDEVRVRLPGVGGHRELAEDFAGFLPATGGEGRVTVTGDGPVAVAVYALAERPPGITEGGITLRQDVHGARLLTGEVGELGATELTVEAVVPESGRLAVATACQGVPEDLVVVVEEPNGLYSYGSCPDDPPLVDAASRDWTPLALRDQGIEAGDTVTLRMYVGKDVGAERDLPAPVTEGAGLERVRLAAGFYETPEPKRVGRAEFDRLIEHDGHRWELVDTVVSDPGTATLSAEVPVPDGGPTLVAVAVSGLLPGKAFLLRDGGTESSFANGTDDPAGFFERHVEERPGHVYTLQARSALGPDTVLSFGYYRRLD